MEARDSAPAIMLADKGYGSDPIRQDLGDRGAVPEIPTKRNRQIQHCVSRPLYALRSCIECFIDRLKNGRRVAMRYGHTADSFLLATQCCRASVKREMEIAGSSITKLHELQPKGC